MVMVMVTSAVCTKSLQIKKTTDISSTSGCTVPLPGAGARAEPLSRARIYAKVHARAGQTRGARACGRCRKQTNFSQEKFLRRPVPALVCLPPTPRLRVVVPMYVWAVVQVLHIGDIDINLSKFFIQRGPGSDSCF